MTAQEGVFLRGVFRRLMAGQCAIDRAFRELELAAQRLGTTPMWDSFGGQAERLESEFEEHREIYELLADHLEACGGGVIAMKESMDRYFLAGELLRELDELSGAFVLTLHARLGSIRDLRNRVYDAAKHEKLPVTFPTGTVGGRVLWDLGNFLKHRDEWPAQLTEPQHRRMFEWFKNAGLASVKDGAREFVSHLITRALKELASAETGAAAIRGIVLGARENAQKIVREVEQDFEPYSKEIWALRAKDKGD